MLYKQITIVMPLVTPIPAVSLIANALATHDVMVSGAVVCMVTVPSGLKIHINILID